MKKPIITIFIFLCLAHLWSCGPSAYQQAQIQRHDDSIKHLMESKYSSGNDMKEPNQGQSGGRSK